MWALKFVSGENLHKCILFILNFLILVFAIALITRAVVLKTSTTGLDIKEVSNFGVALGVIIGVVAVTGCWGVIRENPHYLIIYAAVLLTFFFIQLPFIILTFLLGARSVISKVVYEHLSIIYNERNDKEIQKHINDFQQAFHCCGLQGPKGPEVILNSSTSIMQSCCKAPVVSCTHQLALQDSCTDELSQIIAENLEVIGIIALFFGVFELGCALFIFFIRGVRKERDDLEESLL